jgi:hypothetical protein
MSSTTLAVGVCHNKTERLNGVRLFDRIKGQWQQSGELSQPPSLTGGGYGTQVAVSDSEIAVAAPNAGEVYTYRKTARGWKMQDLLVGEVPFGRALALAGSRLDVTDGAGVTSDNNGPIDVYTLAGPASRGLGVLQESSAPGGFGDALAEFGGLTLVGAPGFSTTTRVPSAAYLFLASPRP